jgi:hypothetical protein
MELRELCRHSSKRKVNNKEGSNFMSTLLKLLHLSIADKEVFYLFFRNSRKIMMYSMCESIFSLACFPQALASIFFHFNSNAPYTYLCQDVKKNFQPFPPFFWYLPLQAGKY